VNVLAIDIGGTHAKILVSGEQEARKFPSGPQMTPQMMVAGVKKLAADWKFEARPVTEPHNLAKGWTTFDFQRAFKRPVKFMNDAAMQALGSYRGGKMLFLGLGTGLGTTMIVNGIVEPMELAHLPYKKATYEDYIGLRGLKKRGEEKWSKHVAEVVEQLIAALEPDDIVLGGGNAKLLKKLPEGCRLGDNANAFLGGFRLWTEKSAVKQGHAPSQ
jgi:polyphosphate glucokinase